MGPPSLVLGIDLGTSSLKAVAVDGHGAVVGVSRAGYPSLGSAGGRTEQAPADWLAALSGALSELRRGVPLERTAAIGLAGQVPCIVAIERGRPAGPAITWQDGRADTWTEARLTPESRRALYRRTGMPVDGRYIGPMFAFHYGRHGRQPDTVLSAKDYLYRELTGEAWTDPSTAAGYAAFDLATGAFAPDLLALWGLSTDQVPPVAESTAAPARLAAAAAARYGLRAGIPVHVGAADSVAAVLAVGGMTDGRVTLVPGSSTVVLRTSWGPRLDRRARYLVTPHVATGWYGLETDLLSTGSAVAWLAALANRPEAELVAAAADVPVGARGLSVAPYLAGGEQGVLWQGDVAGAVLGLRLGHGAPELMRAVLEGVAMEVRRCLAVLTCDTARPNEVLVAGGERAAAPTFERLLADVLALPVRRVALESAAGYGAAILTGRAGVAAGDAQTLVRAHEGRTAVFRPDRQRAALYEALYRGHAASFPRLARPLSWPPGAGQST